MKKYTIFIAALLAVALPLTACAGAAEPAIPPDTDDAAPGVQDAPAVIVSEGPEEPNFRLLLSDEPNDIGDFEELWVMVSGLGLVQDDGEGIVEHQFETPAHLDLAPLTGENAIALWQGNVPEGTYTKVFLYVDEVHGKLVGGEVIEIKLPSNKLQVNAPVTVGEENEGEFTEYVFDVSVHRAGASGMYILKPQVTESGQGQQYRLLEQTEERVRTTRPEWAGRPESPGKSESRGNAGNNRPEDVHGDDEEDDDDGLPGIEVEKEAEATEEGVFSIVTITNDSDVEVTVLTVTDTVYWHQRGPDWEYLDEVVDDEGHAIEVGDSLVLEYTINVEVPAEARELRNEVQVVIEGREKVFGDRVSFLPFGYVEEIEFEGTIDELEPSLVVTTDGGTTYTVEIDQNTEIEGTLEPGVYVEVEGWLQTDDTILATEIEVEEQDDD